MTDEELIQSAQEAWALAIERKPFPTTEDLEIYHAISSRSVVDLSHIAANQATEISSLRKRVEELEQQRMELERELSRYAPGVGDRND